MLLSIMQFLFSTVYTKKNGYLKNANLIHVWAHVFYGYSSFEYLGFIEKINTPFLFFFFENVFCFYISLLQHNFDISAPW